MKNAAASGNPRGPRGTGAGFSWSRLLWAIVAPRRSQRTVPTISGLLLVLVAMGIGTAAYNAANNILFITLSLLLACLILSGVLSWLNFRGVSWRLRIAPPLRAGRETVVAIEIANAKRILPTHALWFDLAARAVDRAAPARAETTFTGRGIDVRAALAQADAAEARARLFLEARLAPAGAGALEWILRPRRRGVLRVELESVGSLFPFGFLRKYISGAAAEEVVVWPEPIDYRRLAAGAARRQHGGERVARVGGGSDLLALRRYESGDSHRLIHWKASARTGHLLVRQFAAESAERFSLWLQTTAAHWPEAEQFELAVRLAAAMAEDLFRADQLVAVALDGEPPRAVRRGSELESWLDRLATIVLRPAAGPGGAVDEPVARGGRNVITFAPDGPHRVAAFIHGEKIATA